MPDGAKALGKLDEIWILEVRGDDSIVEPFLLLTLHISEGITVEDDCHEGDVIADCCCQFLHVEHEAAVAGDRNDRLARMGDLHAKSRCKSVAERALVAAIDVRAWTVYGEPVPGSIAA